MIFLVNNNEPTWYTTPVTSETLERIESSLAGVECNIKKDTWGFLKVLRIEIYDDKEAMQFKLSFNEHIVKEYRVL